jgi:Asp-tRNA(Asn)/Glu-tRNA(Gln) amidotransferase A subunit family amidase
VTEPSACEWLRRLKAGDLSASELTDHYLTRLERIGARLNAVAALNPEARQQAADADQARASGEARPLLGLPVTVKDSIAVAGLPLVCGSLARAGHYVARDATVVRRLREAGAIVVAKTAVPEYTWSYETESVIGGRTLNPYDPKRTCGGSSGGEGALLAADASPVGIGTDGLGSIRVPSHFCGVFGLRPTTGLVPETGVWPTTRDTGMLDMSCVGPMGRSVDDLALLLPLIAGIDGEDPFASGGVVHDYRAVDVSRLRVGFYVFDGVWHVTPGTAEAVTRAAVALEEIGAAVEEARPPILADVTEVAFGMMAADGGAQARSDLAAAGGRHVPQLRLLLENLSGTALSAAEFFGLMRRWIELRAHVRTFIAAYDVLLCPVVAGPAPLHGRRPGDDGELDDYRPFAYAQAYSVAGLPVAVVPAGSERGLPLGVQIVANPVQDHVALAAAAALETALADARPAPPAALISEREDDAADSSRALQSIDGLGQARKRENRRRQS